VGAGAICFMIYSRTRHSDTQRLTEVKTDFGHNENGFIEAKAQAVKNARTAELKTQLLPIVLPSRGLGFKTFGSWWAHYVTARQEAGLHAITDPDEPKIVLWPRKDTNGSWTTVSCTFDDYGKLMRQILRDQG